jgi:hypothetical protein
MRGRKIEMLKDNLLPSASQLESIARETELIQRRSPKFNASGFLMAMLQSVTKGDTSLNQIVMHLSSFVPKGMTRQAMFQRFGPASSRFLLKVIQSAIKQRHPAVFDLLNDAAFTRVIVEDSTVISMAKSNAANFPNNGNGRYETAGCKCLLTYDLLRGKAIDFQLHAARESDQALAFETADRCRKGDLIVRDMGFFCVEALRVIGSRNAFWISRLPASTSLRSESGKPLAKLLASAKGDVLDLSAHVGREGLSCRLIAIRLDPQRAAANRRHIRAEAKRRRVTTNKETLLRAGWRILVTNVDQGILDAQKVSDIYALRWDIEIKFRAFKQSCQLSRGLKHKSSHHHIEAMALTAMLYQMLTIHLHARLSHRETFRGWLSMEKLSDAFSIHLMQLTNRMDSWLFDPDPRHLRYERRIRINHWQSIIHSLA